MACIVLHPSFLYASNLWYPPITRYLPLCCWVTIIGENIYPSKIFLAKSFTLSDCTLVVGTCQHWLMGIVETIVFTVIACVGMIKSVVFRCLRNYIRSCESGRFKYECVIVYYLLSS